MVLGRPHPVGHARRRVGHSQCCQGLLPPDARVVLRKTDAPPGSGGLGGGGGTGGAFQYRSEERPADSLWARWVRADLRDAAPQRCPGAQASAVGTKIRKRSKSLDPTSAARTEYDIESSSEGEYRFMECDQ